MKFGRVSSVGTRSMAKRGRPFKLGPGQVAVVAGIVEANPTATLEEIQAELARRTGVEAHGQTIQKILREAGIERRMDGSGVRVEAAIQPRPRAGERRPAEIAVN
jgi:transposase